MRLVITGGGTGGHIYPAIAVAKYFQDVPGTEIIFIGSFAGPEGDSARAAGLHFEGLELSGLVGKDPVAAVRALGRFSAATVRCRRLFKSERPDCLVGTGGYAAAPATFAAAWMKVPFVAIEPNFQPGLVTRVLSRRAGAVAVAFDGTAALLPHGARVRVTGVPVRREIERLASDDAHDEAKEEALRFFELEQGRPTLLVFGGSQGAQALNDALWSVLESNETRADLQILHLTGKRAHQDPRRSRAESKASRGSVYKALPYCYRMELAYGVADLALTRAGAGTIAELAAAALPAVLVPYPYASGHQDLNARELAASGAALVVDQEGDSAERAVREALSLMHDAERLARMRNALRVPGRTLGTEGIAALVEELT